MRISELLDAGGPVFSFEFSPPKTAAAEEALFRTIDRLRPLHPAYVSVTYGAGGSTRDKTIDLVCRIKHDVGIEAMAHLTCVGATQHELADILVRLRDGGIDNVLALRGDPPRDQPNFVRPVNGFGYASELVQFIRARGFPFCVGSACYPEGHPESASRDDDVEHLILKVDAGLEFLITQLFFDNADYFTFLERARGRGVGVPIVPGIMPITNVAQIERLATLCAARIPAALKARLDAVRDDDAAVQRIGVEHATQQCRELLARGAPGIHFFTLNQSPATRAILERLRG
jgi:methylenetetrahydrofolate reductase (NADPH)